MLIGISGKKNSGKDTIYKFLKKEYADKKKFVNKKFADKLKSMVAELLSCSVKQLENRKFKESPLDESWWIYKHDDKIYSYLEYRDEFSEQELIKVSPRWILQYLGTECGREIIHPNIWVNSLINNYDETKDWIVTDVRFRNEAQAIKKAGGMLVRVNRPKEFTGDSTHISETDLDNYEDFDFIVFNDETLKELKEKVHSLKEMIDDKTKFLQ